LDDLQGIDQIILCSECASFLVRGEPQSKRIVWPAFVWKMLTNIHLFAVHGPNLWSFVPDQWRPWWILAMMQMTGLMGSYRCMTLMTPHSKFRDVTFARNVMKDCIQELQLADLVQTMNRYLLPTIPCPWGCMEFYHKAELFDFSSVYLRFLGPLLKVLKGLTVDDIGSVREDYVDLIDYLLLNLDWPITRCVAISLDGCSYVLVCQDHPKGTSK
jgi:hypothetical protein